MERIAPDSSTTGKFLGVKAKKHLTVYRHPGTAPGAGRLEVKSAFAACAHATLGEPDRNTRLASVRDCMKAKGLKTGIFRRKSGAIHGPLAGKVRVTARDGTVTYE